MIKLFQKYPHLILFGMLTSMFSGPGQTFLVSLFIPYMREDFGMSQTYIATLYSLATLLSAFLLPVMGNLLDKVHLIRFTLTAAILLSIGCFVLSQSVGVLTVLIGFFLIRNLGQGTLAMISSTTMARYFGGQRGKALGIANLGYPLSEAIFPILITTWITIYTWRSGWILLGLLTLLFFFPSVLLLLKIHYSKHAIKMKEDGGLIEKQASKELHTIGHWSLGQMIRDWRFYVLLVPVLIPPAYLTALFFHQSVLMDYKAWPITVVAIAFISFAVTRGFMSLLIGPLIDKLTALKLLPITLLPLAIGILGYIYGKHLFWVFFYLTGAGITIGLSMTIKGALYAELYGTKKLGSIKGLLAFFMVLSTSIAPVMMGWLLDQGNSISKILWGMLLFIIIGIGLSVVVAFYPNKRSDYA